MARQQQMAAIAAYLNAPAQPQDGPAEGVPNVQIAPGVNAAAPFTELTADQKRAFDANRQTQQDQAKVEKDLEASRAEQLRQIMEADQQEQDAFEQSAGATLTAARKIGRSANVTLSRIPLPGGLTLPLVILFAFFILLIPVNGHTRLTWLWLVISGNAVIGQGQATDQSPGGGGSGNGNSGGSGTGGGSLPPTTAPVIPLTFAFTSYTGVEEF